MVYIFTNVKYATLDTILWSVKNGITLEYSKKKSKINYI